MARSIREDYPGAWHHVMNRGRNRELIFIDDDDAVEFLFAIHNTVDRFGIEVHAYSLMPNHYHLLVRSPLGNLSAAMKHLSSTYTLAFNRRHKKDGTLFRGRFKSQMVKYEAYLVYLVAYIHLNPLRANLITRIDGLQGWTSYRSYMQKEPAYEWLTTEHVVEMFGSIVDMKKLTMRLHQKSESWPTGLSLDSGWFRWHQCPQDSQKKLPESNKDGLSINILLNDICEITDCKKTRLVKTVSGPGGNMERRFAVWVLHQTTYLTYRQIGKYLKMTPAGVAKNVERSKNDLQQFGNWLETWQTKHPKKLSTVIPVKKP